MSEARPHLSIGEVLSLLQDEFPDVTISKIRFLESQGLLNPERTPSGYRKFYDHDVEQLRWVLRQQKENFLPLKVIKDRLAAGQLDGPASELGVLDLAPAGAGAGSALTTTPGADTVPTRTPATAAGTPSPRAPVPPRRPGATPPATPAPGDAVRADGATPPPSGAAEAPTSTGPRNDADRPKPETPSAPQSAPQSAPPSERSAPPPAPSTASHRPHPDAAMGSSASLTTEELCAATGVSTTLLAELERYGLVDGRALGADTVYDDEAMVICRLAATMAGAGIEARHLRMFKVAAEREAGLYEQLALPVLRGRRPEGRQEAVAQVTALTGTAAELHAALLRRALRGTFGPL